jgi:hypothetical protein
MGYGQKARIRAERVCRRLRDTPEKPGEAWDPTFSGKRRDGTESHCVVLTGTRRRFITARPSSLWQDGRTREERSRAGEQVSTGYGTVGDSPRSQRREESSWIC